VATARMLHQICGELGHNDGGSIDAVLRQPNAFGVMADLSAGFGNLTLV
jgi:hypothetical protein